MSWISKEYKGLEKGSSFFKDELRAMRFPRSDLGLPALKLRKAGVVEAKIGSGLKTEIIKATSPKILYTPMFRRQAGGENHIQGSYVELKLF